ncbi:hypothetical protein C6P46_004650 [Rhodotorula mucilaginosa]|uniref:Major facilitator superfamily (MFS) profile domain-containing protein n=1 Tax=Rhodotorula mucilaginosa TaxID=5537 RepID=A0A9P6W0H6_RHOMI|nr:hypothetical protein C6P46_004650 [Rhodotorula mucilaginosa]
MATPMQQPEPTQQLPPADTKKPEEAALADPTIEDAATTTQLPDDAKTNAAGVPSYFGLTGTKLISAITAVASTGFLLFGYDQGVMSGIITGREFIDTFPACDAAVQGASRAALLQATYVALYEIGCLAGAVVALFYGNKTGRRRMIIYGAIVMMVGVVIQVTTFKGHWAGGQFIVGRIITGIGNGMNTSTIPSWMAECSRSHNRGLLICIEASMIATGTAIAYWLDFGLSFIHSSFNWRFPIAFQVFFAILLIWGVVCLPESPRWLMHEGRHVDAQRVVAALADDAYDSEATILQTRLIMQSIEQSHQLGYLGTGRTLSLILGGVNVTVYALAAFASFFTIERFGRRKMFLGGTIGQCVSLIITMACLIPGEPKSALNGAVFGLFLFLFFFGSTWLQLPWLYPAEINPLRTRTNANAVSTLSNWLFNFTVVQFTPVFLDTSAAGCFGFFALMNLLFIPMIYFFYPETAGRTLEEIDLIFAKGYAEHRSYVNVSLELPKLNDTEVRDELDRLHREHESRKGRLPAEEVGAGMPGSDQNTLANAEAEIEADALATNEKKPAAGGEKRNL